MRKKKRNGPRNVPNASYINTNFLMTTIQPGPIPFTRLVCYYLPQGNESARFKSVFSLIDSTIQQWRKNNYVKRLILNMLRRLFGRQPFVWKDLDISPNARHLYRPLTAGSISACSFFRPIQSTIDISCSPNFLFLFPLPRYKEKRHLCLQT